MFIILPTRCSAMIVVITCQRLFFSSEWTIKICPSKRLWNAAGRTKKNLQTHPFCRPWKWPWQIAIEMSQSRGDYLASGYVGIHDVQTNAVLEFLKVFKSVERLGKKILRTNFIAKVGACVCSRRLPGGLYPEKKLVPSLGIMGVWHMVTGKQQKSQLKYIFGFGTQEAKVAQFSTETDTKKNTSQKWDI